MPLRTVRLPRDCRQRAGHPPRCGRRRRQRRRRSRTSPRRRPTATRPRSAVVRAAGRALGTAVANLIGILDVREIVVHGSVTVLGEPWLTAIRDEATRRSLGPLARETRIIDGGLGDDLTLLGACALLLTSELGLTVHR